MDCPCCLKPQGDAWEPLPCLVCGAGLCDTCLTEHPCVPIPPLWANQVRGIDGLVAAFHEGHRCIVLVAPCGSGKSRIMVELARRAADKGNASMIAAARRILIGDKGMAKEMARARVAHATIANGFKADWGRLVNVASVQTLYSRVVKLRKWSWPDVKLVELDEFHEQRGQMALAMIGHYLDAGAVVVLVSATPVDADKMGATALVEAGTKAELRAAGKLVPCHVYCPEEPDLKGVTRNKLGEYAVGDQIKAFWQYVVHGDFFEHWKRIQAQYHYDGDTLLWAPGIKESRYCVEWFQKKGVKAAHVDKDTTDAEREDLIAAHQERRVKVLSSVGVFRAGVDLPWARHGVLLQVCGAYSTAMQVCGRLARACDGKSECVLQDHCLDQQTEVLTARGWVGRSDIENRDLVAAFDRDTGGVSWQPIIRKIDRAIRPGEKMYSACGPSVDIRVTANHRIVFKKRTTGGAGSFYWPESWSLGRADGLAKSKVRFRVPVSGVQKAKGVPLTDDEIRFIGWFMTDGTMGRSAVRIYQSAHQPQITELQECLEGCGFDYTVRRHKTNSILSDNPCMSFEVPKGNCPARPRCGWGYLEPYLNKNFSLMLECLSESQFEVLLHAIHLGDGSKFKNRNPGSYRIFTGNKIYADRLQSMCVRRGFRCNITTNQPVAGVIRQRSPIYVLNVKKMGSIHIHGSKPVGGQTSLRESVVAPGERVWCVQNPLGTIIVRRNGKVAIVGNSGIWWRHGDPNEDRLWAIGDSDRRIAKALQESYELGEKPQPVRCPQCGGVRFDLSGQCPFCGWEHVKSVRLIRCTDGTLVRKVGNVYRKKKKFSEEEQVWRSCLYACASKGMTLRQAAGWYKKRTGRWPSGDFQSAPIPERDSAAWHQRVSDVYPWLKPRRPRQEA